MVRRLIPLLGVVAVFLTGCAPVTPVGPSGPSGSVSPPGGSTSGADTIGTVDPTSPPDFRIPAAAMLTGEDVGPGYTAEEWLQGDDHGSIDMMLAYCGVYDYSEAVDHEITYRRGSAGRGDEEHYVLETVKRYEPGWAQRYIDDVVATLPGCASIPVMGNPNDVAVWTIAGMDFAGDGSLLIHEEWPGGVQFHALVRQGDVVAVLRIHTGGDEDHAGAIVDAAAERLCAAADSC